MALQMTENKARRVILDWLWELLLRAISEQKYKLATEAHEVMDRIYGMPRKGEK